MFIIFGLEISIVRAYKLLQGLKLPLSEVGAMVDFEQRSEMT